MDIILTHPGKQNHLSPCHQTHHYYHHHLHHQHFLFVQDFYHHLENLLKDQSLRLREPGFQPTAHRQPLHLLPLKYPEIHSFLV